jgi:Flp pilus assembly pilin Flp
MPISVWWNYVRLNWRKEEGQTMAEYGVVLAVITAGALLAFTNLGTAVGNAIGKVTKSLGG